jgi:hypothetical protein
VRRIAVGFVLLAFPLSLNGCYAATDPAANVGSWTAVLNANGYTDSSPAHFYFEYAAAKADLGTPQALRTPTRQIPANVRASDGKGFPFSEKVSPLEPATTYWFRICGGDAQTTQDVCGAARSFTTQPGIPGLKVSVGYANDEANRGSTEGFPADWGSGSGTTGSVTFLGDRYYVPQFNVYIWDSGGVRFDNTTAAPISLDKVTVAIGTRRYNGADDLWPPAQLVVPAHGTLILASAGGKDFDTSDALGLKVGCSGPPLPPTPEIEVTRAGVKTTFYDTFRALPSPTTKFGVLSFDCGPENHPWTRVDVVK